MKNPPKVKAMQDMPVHMVGDGKNPNVFFVSDQGVIVGITTDWGVAYDQWRALAVSHPRRECCLEDRKFGTICDVSPQEDSGDRLIRSDDSYMFLKRYPKHRRP